MFPEKRGRSRSESNYTDILRIIGISPKPLSSREIEVGFTKDSTIPMPHVYFMLKKLFQRTAQPFPLFIWEKFPGDSDYTQKVAEKLKDVFHLRLPGDAYRNSKDDVLKIQKSTDQRLITIELSKERTVRIELLRQQEKDGDESRSTEEAISTYTHPEYNQIEKRRCSRPARREHQLIVTRNRSDMQHQISVDILAARYPIRYLDVVMKEQKTITTRNVARIDEDNSRNWRYVLNINGLIRYMLGEIEEEQQKAGRRKHNARVAAMLKNLSIHYPDRFPFLRHYEIFRQEYKRMEEEEEEEEKEKSGKRRPSFYEVKILKVIASELQYFVHTADLEYLRYYVTKRYSEMLTYYFTSSLKAGMIKNLGRYHIKSFRTTRDIHFKL